MNESQQSDQYYADRIATTYTGTSSDRTCIRIQCINNILIQSILLLLFDGVKYKIGEPVEPRPFMFDRDFSLCVQWWAYTYTLAGPFWPPVVYAYLSLSFSSPIPAVKT